MGDIAPSHCSLCTSRGSTVQGPPSGPAIDMTNLVERKRQDETAEVYYIRYQCSECNTYWLYNHEIGNESLDQIGDDFVD